MATSATPETAAGEGPQRRALRVGLLGSEKKFRTFFDSFMRYCAADGGAGLQCEALLLDEIAAAPEGGYPPSWDRCDVLLHKLSDDIAASSPFDLDDVIRRGPEGPVAEVLPLGAAVDKAADGNDARSAADFYSPSERALALRAVQAVLAWQAARPERRLVFERPQCVALTTRRVATHRALDEALKEPLPTRVRVTQPYTRLVPDEAALAAELAAFRRFQCGAVVKSDVACGKSTTHHMRLVTSTVANTPRMSPVMERDGGLRRIVSTDEFVPVSPPPYPRVMQRAVVDAAVVLKVYVLGPTVLLRVIRNGIPWSPEPNDTAVAHWFSSQQSAFFPVTMESTPLPAALTSEPACTSPFDGLDESVIAELDRIGGSMPTGGEKRAVVLHAVACTAHRLRQRLGLEMFGFDVAIGVDASAPPAQREDDDAVPEMVMHLLDVNYFPGYKGIRDVNAAVAALVRGAYARHTAACRGETQQ